MKQILFIAVMLISVATMAQTKRYVSIMQHVMSEGETRYMIRVYIDTTNIGMKLTIEGDTTNAPLVKMRDESDGQGNEVWETPYDPKLHAKAKAPMYIVMYSNYKLLFVKRLSLSGLPDQFRKTDSITYFFKQ